eukprot:5617628-Pyramimonas_sp.AAC.1
MQVPIGIELESASDTRSNRVRLLRVSNMQVPKGIQVESSSDARSNRVRLLRVSDMQVPTRNWPGPGSGIGPGNSAFSEQMCFEMAFFRRRLGGRQYPWISIFQRRPAIP